MKKFLKVLVILVFSLSLVGCNSEKKLPVELPEKTDHEKVTIHLFWWSQCGHCHDLIEWFGKYYTDYADYFEFVTYETATAENGMLVQEMAKYHEDIEGGVPLVIIGDEYHKAGFGNDGTDIIKAALAEYNNPDYKDIVKEAISKNELNLKTEKFEEACKTMNVKCGPSETSISDILVIAIIFVVIIGGFAGLTILSRKK